MTFPEIVSALYLLAIVTVIGGHFFFAYGQWMKWPDLCRKLTELEGAEVDKTAFLGRSIASYNASIGVGLALSFLLPDGPRAWVQGTILVLIVATAAVGASGTKGGTILKYRLAPAVLALVFLTIG